MSGDVIYCSVGRIPVAGSNPENTASPQNFSEASASQPDCRKVSAIVVTYRPELDELKQTVERAADQVGSMVIFQNDPDGATRSSIEDLVREIVHNHPGVALDVLTDGANVGLSRGYNKGLQKAREFGAEFALLLDQDSRLEPGAVASLISTYHSVSARLAVGVLSCTNVELVQINLPLIVILDRLRSGLYETKYGNLGALGVPSAREIPIFTNSGTLVPIARVDQVGPFDEALFLDAVDYEFSLRLRANGLHIYLSDAARVLHKQGSTLRRSILGYQLDLRTFPPERSYHIVRDTLTFSRKWWGRYPKAVAGIMVSLVTNTLGGLLLLPQHSRRFQMVIRAIADFGHRTRSLPGPKAN